MQGFSRIFFAFFYIEKSSVFNAYSPPSSYTFFAVSIFCPFMYFVFFMFFQYIDKKAPHNRYILSLSPAPPFCIFSKWSSYR